MKSPSLQKIDRYRIEKELGVGGSAVAYLAHDPSFNKRDVTIKILKSDDPVLRRRFQKEVEILASLQHPAIVPVYDFRDYEGKPFLVMRYMAGGSLGGRLQAGPLSLSEASLILDRLAAALAAAHKRGIIHRDIKPANVLLDEEGRAYLSDFGTAIVVGEERETVHGAVTGSPEYMAPEQITWKHDLSVQTDVYQLGVVLFEMLAGERPFTGDDVMAKHIHEPVPRVTAVNPELPPACDDLLAKAMAKEPSERFATPGVLAAALAEIMTDESMKQQNKNKPFNIEECYEQGMVAFEAENWEKAVLKLLQVIKTDFEYEDAASKLAEAREFLASQIAAVIKQRDIDIAYLKADNHFQQERWGKAAAKFQEVVEQQPDFRDASAKLKEARKQEELERLYKTAVGQCEKGEWGTAVVTFKKIQAIDATYKEVAVKLQQAEEEVTLAEQYDKALESLTYGKEHYYESRFNRAKKQFQAIQKKRPNYRDVVLKLKEIEKQLALLELYQSAILYETKGKWLEAIKAYGDLLGQSPVYRDAASRLTAVKVKAEGIYQKGKAAFQQQDWEKAIEQFRQCVGYKDADKLLLQAKKQKKLAQRINSASERKNSQGGQMTNELTASDLVEILKKHFNEGELRELSLKMKIDYDGLPGRGKAEKALELVEHARRYGRIRDLTEAIKKERSHIFPNDDPIPPTTGNSSEQKRLQKKWRLMLGGIALVSILILAGIFYSSRGGGRTTPVAPTPSPTLGLVKCLDTAVATLTVTDTVYGVRHLPEGETILLASKIAEFEIKLESSEPGCSTSDVYVSSYEWNSLNGGKIEEQPNSSAVVYHQPDGFNSDVIDVSIFLLDGKPSDFKAISFLINNSSGSE